MRRRGREGAVRSTAPLPPVHEASVPPSIHIVLNRINYNYICVCEDTGAMIQQKLDLLEKSRIFKERGERELKWKRSRVEIGLFQVNGVVSICVDWARNFKGISNLITTTNLP